LGNYAYTGNSYQQAGLNTLTPFALYHYQADSLQQLTYNAFKQPVKIEVLHKESINFQYNGDLQRSHMYYGSDTTDKMLRPFRRHYSEDGSMEITEDLSNGKTSFVFYLGGDAYSAPAIWKHEQTASATTANLYYLHRDHLGSILMITDVTGAIKEKRQFDAWGNIVKLEDGNGNALTAFAILDRGYTGHEHLLGVGLINMNGRLYDPLLHRFLSPDNYVQDPTNTQNFNRYGYVMNNPLKYTDESGQFWNFVIGGVIGGAINWYFNGHDFSWKGLGYFAVGALAGAVGVGVGQAATTSLNAGGFIGGAIVGAATGGASGFISGAGNAWVGGANFMKGLGSGLTSGLLGALGGGVLGGYLSGVDAYDSNANFWNGRVDEVGGYTGKGRYLDEEVPPGEKPTATGEIAKTSTNPKYGQYGKVRNGGTKDHFGFDFSGNVGDPVSAMYDGKVTQLGNSDFYGPNFVRTSSMLNNKLYNVDYGHMSKQFLTLNQQIKAKDLVGLMGRLGNLSGTSFPTHVHIAIWRPIAGGLQGFVMPKWR
jgi:RHS repeat-associated protein